MSAHPGETLVDEAMMAGTVNEAFMEENSAQSTKDLEIEISDVLDRVTKNPLNRRILTTMSNIGPLISIHGDTIHEWCMVCNLDVFLSG